MKYYLYQHHRTFNWGLNTVENPHDADVFLLWTDYVPECEPIIQVARAKKKGLILYQHGRYAMDEYSLYHKKCVCDGVLVWGEDAKAAMKLSGVPEKRIMITGNPMFNGLHKNVRTDFDKPLTILFSALHWDTDMKDVNYKAVEVIVDAKQPTDKLVIKTMDKCQIPQLTEEYCRVNNVEMVDGRVNGEGNLLLVKDVVNRSDVLITLRESTLELFGRLMGKNVINLGNITDDLRFADREIPEQQRGYQYRIQFNALKDSLDLLRKDNFSHVTDGTCRSQINDEIRRPAVSAEQIDEFIKGVYE